MDVGKLTKEIVTATQSKDEELVLDLLKQLSAVAIRPEVVVDAALIAQFARDYSVQRLAREPRCSKLQTCHSITMRPRAVKRRIHVAAHEISIGCITQLDAQIFNAR